MSELTNKAEDTAGGAEGCLKVIQDWFKARCERDWVHHVKFDLATTDNPGWLATFELYTTEAEANSILADSLHRKDVDVSVKNGYIRIYSESLSNCLEACASMMVGAEQSLVQAREDIASSEYPSTRTLIGWIEDDEHPILCDEGEFVKVDAEVADALRALGYTNSVKILNEETFDFNLDVVRPREPYATTLILVRMLPIKPVEFPCPRTGFAVYEQRGDHFVLASSACKFHEDGKIAIKSACDEQGNDGVHYWLKIRDILTMESVVNVVLQK
jgi:hypothetical protein